MTHAGAPTLAPYARVERREGTAGPYWIGHHATGCTARTGPAADLEHLADIGAPDPERDPWPCHRCVSVPAWRPPTPERFAADLRALAAPEPEPAAAAPAPAAPPAPPTPSFALGRRAEADGGPLARAQALVRALDRAR